MTDFWLNTKGITLTLIELDAGIPTMQNLPPGTKRTKESKTDTFCSYLPSHRIQLEQEQC